MKIFLIFLVIVASHNAQAAGLPFQKVRHGIVVEIGQTQVELAVATPAAFCLSVSDNGKPGPPSSIFLANSTQTPPVQWQLVQSGDLIGVKANAGELLINPATREWILKDAAGRTIIPTGEVGGVVVNPKFNKPHITVTVGRDQDSPVSVYGCGNGIGSLQQSQGQTYLSNGVAVIPYYWSPAGYAVLAVTSDNNQPASWSVTPDQVSIVWRFPGRTAALYLMPAANLCKAAEVYAQLTGYPPVPPRWAFGYLQSRWGWKSRAYIENTLRQFVNRRLPVDAFIYDFGWYTKEPDYSLKPSGSPDFKDFGWNLELFPDPAAQIAAYKAQGVHFVGIRKPRLGNSKLLRWMRIMRWGLADGRSLRGSDKRMLNFRNPDVRAWYARHLGPLLACGIDGWWNDEGEATYSTYYYWNLAEDNAQAEFRPGIRLWTINRAFEPGLQRLGAAAWTGDIKSSWQELQKTPTALLNWSLAGMPYAACDIGGFTGTPTPRLLTRWMEAGVFFPVMRAHSTESAKPHFPWLYGQKAENAIRKALDLRYQLIPYYYSLAYETHETGVPLMRPLVMEFPHDPKVSNMSDQWLMGDGLMVAPILSTNDRRSVYLPVGKWYKLNTNASFSGNQTIVTTAKLGRIPIYVHEGTILPLGPVIQHTDEFPGGPLELQVYPGKNTMFTLAEDDGETTAYLKGQFRKTTFVWNDTAHRLSWNVHGPYRGNDIFTTMDIEVFYPEGIRQAKASLLSSGSLQLPSQ